MWYTRENHESRGEKKLIAVAIDKGKSSQHALRWACDHLVTTSDQSLKLVHVKDRIPAPNATLVRNADASSMGQQTDKWTKDLMLPFRCFCRRREVHCETVLLEDSDVASSLIEYICQNGVEILLLGVGSRNGLSRLFKTSDIAGNVMKRTPDFCTVYVISRGRISGLRNATRPVPAIPAAEAARPPQPNLNAESASVISLSKKGDGCFDEDEVSPPDDTEIPSDCARRLSTDSTFFSFYENLESGLAWDSSRCSNLEKHGLPQDSASCTNGECGDFEYAVSGFRPPLGLTSVPESNKLDSDRRSRSRSLQNLEDHGSKMARLKAELENTVDMYHAACKEALAAKQKAMELEQWKTRQERRLQEANLAMEAASAMMKKERDKCKAAIEAAEATQELVKIELQKRTDAEMKALREAEEKKKVLEALGQSHTVIKYQSLFHMIALLLALFYAYYT